MVGSRQAVWLFAGWMPMAAFAVHPAEAPAGNPAAPEVRKYFTTGAFYEFPDSTRAVDDGTGAAYAYGIRLGGKTWAELRAFAATLETGVPGATDFYQYGAGLDLVRHFGKTGGGHPYALIGGGAVQNDVTPDVKDGVSGFATLGFGWRSAPWKDWGVRHRLEVRGVHDTFDAGYTDVLVGFALEVAPRRERVVEKVVEKIVEVEKVVEVEKEVVREVQVAPPDRDGDGVLDARDRCPDTVPGARVGGDGCVHEEQVVVLPSIEFEFASATLTENGRQELEAVVRFMRDQADIRLDVWGHTDAQGTEEYNQRLSERRAAAVRQHLIGNGIAADRLSSKGFGESQPLDPAQNLAAYAKNRRVELHIRARNGAAGE